MRQTRPLPDCRYASVVNTPPEAGACFVTRITIHTVAVAASALIIDTQEFKRYRNRCPRSTMRDGTTQTKLAPLSILRSYTFRWHPGSGDLLLTAERLNRGYWGPRQHVFNRSGWSRHTSAAKDLDSKVIEIGYPEYISLHISRGNFVVTHLWFSGFADIGPSQTKERPCCAPISQYSVSVCTPQQLLLSAIRVCLGRDLEFLVSILLDTRCDCIDRYSH